jgi:flagellar biosynthesis anti-sigma factor FlgM
LIAKEGSPMKIENNGSTPVSPKKVDNVSSAGKKTPLQRTANAEVGKDRAEVTENARLLAKARASLDSLDGAENERLDMLRREIESGNYQIPVEDLARRLYAKHNLISNSGDE